MSPGGPTPTSRDVCFRAAVWGLADMPPTWLIDANDPKLPISDVHTANPGMPSPWRRCQSRLAEGDDRLRQDG
jgi:hypothetical protein